MEFTALQTIDYRYRLSFLKLAGKVFLFPTAGAFICLYTLSALTSLRIPGWTKALFLVSSIPIYWTTKNILDHREAKSEANRQAASLAPVYQGNLLGNLDALARLAAGNAGGHPGAIFDELLDESGCDTLNLRILWQDKIISRDHHILKFILSTGFDFFERAPGASDRAGSFLGDGLLVTTPPKAKQQRAIARPYFSRERINDYRIFNHYTDKTVAIFQRCAETQQPCNIQEVFSRFTIDTAGEFLFRTEINSLDAPLPEPHSTLHRPSDTLTKFGSVSYEQFAEAMEAAQFNVIRRRSSGIKWYIQEFFNDSQAKHIAIVRRWIDPLVSQALKREAKRKEDGGPLPMEDPENATFIDHLAASCDNPVMVRDQLFNLLLAARDTTSTLLTFVTYLLSLHPEIMEKLRTEVLETCGTSEAPSLDILRGMRYLRAVLNETLRLFPPITAAERSNRNACVIPTSTGRLYVPRGSVINGVKSSIHVRKDLWGDDAHDFDPERWLDHRVKRTATDPFMFIPFSAGPRICLGQQFAYNQASFMLVRMLQKFDHFTLAQEEAAPESLPPPGWNKGGRKYVDKVRIVYSVMISSKGGMWMKMHRANQ